MMHIPYYLLVMIALILWWHYCVKPGIELERRYKYERRAWERENPELVKPDRQMKAERRRKALKWIGAFAILFALVIVNLLVLSWRNTP